MGEAKRRGTREQRIEQAIERRKAEDAAVLEASRVAEEAYAEKIRNLPPEARKEVLMRRASPKRYALLAAALALSLPSALTSTTARKP